MKKERVGLQKTKFLQNVVHQPGQFIMPLSCQNGIFLGIPIKKIPVRYSR